MRRIVPLAIVAVIGLAVSSASAGITMSATEVPINATLAADGWTGYVLTLSADAASQGTGKNGIVTLDFANDPLNLGVPIGIRGNLHQAWILDNSGNNPPVASTPTPTGAVPGKLVNVTDSMFLNPGYYTVSVPNAFTEDNNHANGTNPPFTVSPLPDNPGDFNASVNGVDYGVGSFMTFAGAANGSDTGGTSQNTLDFAFVIVPKGGAWSVGYNPDAMLNVDGAALDASSVDKSKAFAIQYSYAGVIPEPASLGMLAIGGLALLARRRK